MHTSLAPTRGKRGKSEIIFLEQMLQWNCLLFDVGLTLFWRCNAFWLVLEQLVLSCTLTRNQQLTVWALRPLRRPALTVALVIPISMTMSRGRHLFLTNYFLSCTNMLLCILKSSSCILHGHSLQHSWECTVSKHICTPHARALISKISNTTE